MRLWLSYSLICLSSEPSLKMSDSSLLPVEISVCGDPWRWSRLSSLDAIFVFYSERSSEWSLFLYMGVDGFVMTFRRGC